MAKKPKSVEVKIGTVKFVESGKGALIEEITKGGDSAFVPKDMLEDIEGAGGKLSKGEVVQFEVVAGQVKSIKTIVEKS